MKKVLVTGATGKIGPLLVAELLRQQFHVRLFLRHDSIDLLSVFSQNVEIFYGDIRDYQAVFNAVSGVDYIFHLAALLHKNNPPLSIYSRYYDINVMGTHNIIDASLKAGVKRVILFSSISVYGAGLPSQIFYETSKTNPVTIYAKTKLFAEERALGNKSVSAKCLGRVERSLATEKNCTSSDFHSIENAPSSLVTILRLASVYGSRVTGNYQLLIKAVRTGFFCIPHAKGGCGAVRTLIHENDVVAGAILAATHPYAAGKTYNLTDGQVHSLEEIIKAIAEALSVKIKILKIPEEPLRIFSDFIHKHHHQLVPFLSQKIENTACAIDKLMENIVVDSQKIQTEIGFKPMYNLRKGWHHALSEKRN